MRFGIVLLPDERWAGARERWRRAEALGFDHAWTYDHLGWRDLVDGPWFDAVATLAAAASVTSRIGLGTYVASPNFRHPAAFARAVTALDDISGGRFVLGVGAGGKGFDSEVLGQAPLGGRERIDRFTEFVDLLARILQGPTTAHGTHFTAVDARAFPGPLRPGGIPFWLAGNFPRSIAFAARHGDGWVTTGGGGEDLEGWWRRVAENVARFEDAVDGRTPVRSLSLDAAPGFSLESLGRFTDMVGRAQELGFTDVVTHWPRASAPYAGSECVLEEVAGAFLAR